MTCLTSIITWTKHIDLQNENMIMKEVKLLYFSRLSCPQKNTQAVYCVLLADVFIDIRLFHRRVKNHSKYNPSWFWYMFYANIKGLCWRSLREFGVMAHVEKYLRILFLNWEYQLRKQKQFFNNWGFSLTGAQDKL